MKDKKKKNHRWVTIATMARLLNICRSSAYELARRGEVVAAKFGGSVRVREDSIDDYILRQISRFQLEE